jgi:hypothetical protein
LDGTDPALSSTRILYTGPVSVSVPATLKAVAIKAGLSNSAVMTQTYTLLSTVATPMASPSGGTYAGAQTVTLSSTTTGASIYYTLDGTDPASSGTRILYTGPVSVSFTAGTPAILRAVAVLAGMADSAVMTQTYTFGSPAATPTATPPGGSYTSPLIVTLSSATAGASIYYTTNGADPASSVTRVLYTNSIYVNISWGVPYTLKAVAIKDGMAYSAVMTQTYTLRSPTPTASPPGGAYAGAQTVTLSSAAVLGAPQAASILYTLDGTDPLSSGILYTGPFTVNAPATLKAVAVTVGMANSAVMTETYTLLSAAATPTVSPPGGAYDSPLTVTLFSATTGASIYDILNGTESTYGNPRIPFFDLFYFAVFLILHS